MEFVTGFFNIHSLISFIIGLLPSGFFAYKLVSFLIRKEIRLFNNLKRTIYLMEPGLQNFLQREKTMLERNGLYKVYSEILNLSDLGLLEITDKFSIFVIAYSDNFSSYQSIIDRAKRDLIPVIFLAAPGDITHQHMEIFKAYPYFEMCNSSSRLLTTIFTLSAVTPNEKR